MGEVRGVWRSLQVVSAYLPRPEGRGGAFCEGGGGILRRGGGGAVVEVEGG